MPELIVASSAPPHAALGAASAKAKLLKDYHLSEAESNRWDWANGVGPFDSIGVDALSEALRRATATSKWLRLYDAYFTSETGSLKRTKSLRLLFGNWFRSCIHPVAERSVEIFCADQNSAVGISRLESAIREIQNYYPIKFDLRVLKNTNSLLHARHLQTQNFVVLVDPGFDFFNSDDTLRHVMLKPARGDKEHLRMVRGLTVSYSAMFPPPRL